MNLADPSWALAPAPGPAASVCIVAHAHPDFSKGGGETAAHREFLAVRQAGFRATLVAAVEGLPGCEAMLPHAPGEFLFATSGMTEDRLSWDDLAARQELVRFLARQPARVFHFHHLWRIGIDVVAELMEARPDARFVITLHEMLAICANHGQMVRPRGRELCRAAAPALCSACFPDRPPRHFALRRAAFLEVLRRFDAVIYPSGFLRGRYRDWGLVAREEIVLENYLGDALAAHPRRAPDRALAGSFAFFGQPTPFKGLDVLLRGFALARAAEPHLTLSVFGCEREEVLAMFPSLAATIEDAGSALCFAGRYDQAEVLHLMQDAGWVVVPSVWWENSPVVIQEAMRAGTPLIVSGIGGMAEKVRPGLDGLHVRRGSPHDLARVMRQAASPDTHAAIAATLADSIGREAFLAGLERAFGLVAAEMA